jgi:adenylate cyclase
MERHHLTTGQRTWLTKLVIVLSVALGIIVLTQDRLFRLSILERLELASLDYRFAHRHIDPLDSTNVVIVEISEDSFRSVPEHFPWPRSYYAHLVRNLKRAGARVAAIDLIFGGPDNYSVQNDSSFRSAIQETGIAVLAGKREQDNLLYVQTSADLTYGNIFYAVDSALGFVNIRPDADGVYRGYNTAFWVDTSAEGGVAVPTFGFAALNKYFGLPPQTVPTPQGSSFMYAGRTIPSYDRSSILVNYYGPSRTFRHIKFQDVLDDTAFITSEEASSGEQINTFSDPEYGYLNDGTFQGKLVIVGVTVPEYKDLFPVAVGRGEQRGDNLMYGVELHANLIENVLRNDFLRRQPPLTEVVMVMGLTLIAFFGTSFIREWKTRRTLLTEMLAAAGAMALLGVVVLVGMAAFQWWGFILSVTPASLAITSGYVGSTTYHFIAERRQRILIKSMFSTYVHPQLVEELVNDPTKLVLGGRREELTVLFSDLEGFTAISQDLEPERLVALLNEYFSVMSDIVIRNRGTLDKYVGDAIMAFWGAPIPQPNHAALACRTALQMKEALTTLNQKWRTEGKPPLNMRIGLHTGTMVVGNMGATGKFAYTVMGDSVNLASRLEGANKMYQTNIMVSEQTYEIVKDSIFGRKLDRIAVQGRTVPVTIYELLQTREGVLERSLVQAVRTYEEGFTLYLERRFAEAARAFNEALGHRPGDAPSRLFLARAEEYAAAPPPADWDGVYVMKSK